MTNKTTIILTCTMIGAAAASAQTWVSAATGNDANACTRTAPCKTFQRGVNVTPAWGQLGVLDAGEYGVVTISQAMTIDGGGLATVTSVSGVSDAIVVQGPGGSIVQIRNLSVRGGGTGYYGIEFASGGQMVLDNVKVTGFGGSCVVLATGASNSDVVIKDSFIDNCSSSGIYVAGNPVSLAVLNTQIHFANFGLYALSGTITLKGSKLSSPAYGTSTWGIYLNEAASVMVDDCVISEFGVGATAWAGSIQISRSTFTNNTTALQPSGSGQIISNGNNSFYNNGAIGTISGTVILQ